MGTDAVEGRRQRIADVGFDYDAQPKQPVDRCNLCGGDTWTVVSHSDRYGYAAPSTSCNTCSLTVLNPRMTTAAYAQFYNLTYRPLVSAYHARVINAETVKEEQPVYAEQVVSVLQRLPRESRAWSSLLDIGGSTGVVAARLSREFGVTATVLDPAPEEVAEAKKFGIETITGFIEDWHPNGRTFDLVGMFQTVDHLLDIALTIQKVRQVLSDQGLFVLDIVDFRAAYLRSWAIEEATKIDHPFSLTQPTIEAYFRRAGFAVVAKSFAADHLHVLYLCRKTEPDDEALPPADAVRSHFDEIRYVQNVPCNL